MANYKIFSVVIILFFSLSSCVSYDNNRFVVDSSNNDNNDIVQYTPARNNIVPYTLARGEQLARFIETQNRMNRYAKFEHFPTDDVFRDMLSAFEETMRGQIDEALVNITESDIAEFQSLFDILTVEEFFDLFRIIGFMYNIN